MDPCNASRKGRCRNPAAWRPDDLGIAEGQPDHFEGHYPRVHARDHQYARSGQSIESMLIEVLRKLLVVVKQIVEGAVPGDVPVRPLMWRVIHGCRPPL